MEIFKCTESQPHWYVTNRKPIKCVNCGKKEVKPSMFGMPTQEAWESGKWHIAGCQPDYPEHRTWGCCNCNAAYWKDNPRNRAALGGLVPHQWPPEERTEKEKARLAMKWFNEWKKNQVF